MESDCNETSSHALVLVGIFTIDGSMPTTRSAFALKQIELGRAAALSSHANRWSTAQTERQRKRLCVRRDDLTCDALGQVNHHGTAQVGGQRLSRFADHCHHIDTIRATQVQ